ncbi:Stf0 family sulfotransferase [Acidisoma cladoniae]|jgi:LPS sulfotransferase NodH|uniref:Stf0 family sulfotransferase n=1 Tax=Acidisoma cladoniae TaxID=3040935 RepID=UPI00254DFF35|nr:Stf0 family sulfotransferase [Acidisoma sp. PAMC 29798]
METRAATPLTVPPQLAGLERFHRDAIAQVFGPAPPLTVIDGARHYLFICFTNRCGSNYLAHLLASTGRLNEAGEFFNAPTVEAHVRQNGLPSLGAYLNFLGSRLDTSGWLTAKIGIEQLVMLTEVGVLDQIRARTRFILIERRDRVAQAVSRLVAAQNYQWTSRQDARIADDQLVYSREALDMHVASVEAQNHMFLRFFASNGIVPIHLAYEAVVADPQGTVGEIGAALGMVGLVSDPSRIGIAPQESPLKQAWYARYQAGG